MSDGTFVTKGDANKIEDSVTVQKDSIIGKYYGKLMIFQVAWVICINKEAPHTVCYNPTVAWSVYEVKLSLR